MDGDVRYVIPKNKQNHQAETSDPATISRATPVVDVLRDAARHYLANPTEAAVEETAVAAIAKFNADQRETLGVELRHPGTWFLYSLKVVHAQLDAMMYRNQQISGVATPRAFAFSWRRTDRLEIYRLALESPAAQIRAEQVEPDALMYNPFNLLVRLQLLAGEMERHYETDVDIVSVRLPCMPSLNKRFSLFKELGYA